MITIQNYVRAESLEQAWTLNQKRSARIIGGMMWVRLSRRRVTTVIDLSGLGLDKIRETKDAFEIGAMASLRDLETNEAFNKYTKGAAKESVRHIVGVQFRNGATVGGSIFGRFGFSDVLTLFMALDAYVELYKGGIIPMEQFASMKHDNDILVKVIVKKQPLAVSYLSQRNSKTDFPVLAVCTSVWENGKVLASVGARPAKAVCVRDTLTNALDEESAAALAKKLTEKLTFGSNMRACADYRRMICEVLIKRALLSCAGKEG